MDAVVKLRLVETYGTDKPDLCNPLRMRNATPLVQTAGIRAFEGRHVAGMRIWGEAPITRSQLDRFESHARELGAAGLAEGDETFVVHLEVA